MNPNIWAMKVTGYACTKIPYKGYEISISMDDSCGALPVYARSNIAVWHGGRNVTHNLFGEETYGILPADAENLKMIFEKIDHLENLYG